MINLKDVNGIDAIMNIYEMMTNPSLDELTEHYLNNLKEQFGDAIDVSNEFK